MPLSDDVVATIRKRSWDYPTGYLPYCISMTYKYIRWNHLLLPDFTLFNQLDQLTIYGFVPSIHRSSELRVGQFNRVGLCFRKMIGFGIVGNKSYLCNRKGS